MRNWICVLIAVEVGVCAFAELPPPCDPVPVKKPVKVVRREIKVSIIGADRPAGPADASQATAENCFAYWKRWMDKEIANRPDLVVLPEGVLSYKGYGPEKKLEMRNPGAVGAVTVLSHDPALPIDDVIKEFGLVLWDDYYARSVRPRGGALK